MPAGTKSEIADSITTKNTKNTKNQTTRRSMRLATLSAAKRDRR
jgi:hypothetical protein